VDGNFYKRNDAKAVLSVFLMHKKMELFVPIQSVKIDVGGGKLS
jgi:hypothetical protein